MLNWLTILLQFCLQFPLPLLHHGGAPAQGAAARANKKHRRRVLHPQGHAVQADSIKPRVESACGFSA